MEFLIFCFTSPLGFPQIPLVGSCVYTIFVTSLHLIRKQERHQLPNRPTRSIRKAPNLQCGLSEPHSFDAAMEGCTGVFHVAHPVDFEAREPEETVTRRSVEGTLGILKACLNSKTVKRVVYTSSASAVVFNNKDEDMKEESSWSDVEFIRSLGSYAGPYFISKIETERAALEFAEKHGLDLVTLIPSFVLGPFLCPRLPGSVQTALIMIMGTYSSPRPFPQSIFQYFLQQKLMF